MDVLVTIIKISLSTYLDCKIDKKGGKPENLQEYAKNIHYLIDEYNLMDIWRTRNVCDLKYTWRENTKKNGLVPPKH